MITRLRIKNFKCFADTGDLAIKPLTFLMGPNSSGKTSILQALLVIRQTVDSRDMENPLIVDGTYVHLGSYREFVHKGNVRAPFYLQVDLKSRQPFERLSWLRLRIFEGKTPLIEEIQLRSEFAYNPKTMQTLPSYTILSTRPTQLVLERKRTTGANYEIRIRNEREESGPHISSGLQKFYDFGSPARLLYSRRRKGDQSSKEPSRRERSSLREYEEVDWIRFARTLGLELETVFNKLFYLGPLRENPKRVYLATSETPQDVGLRGESAVEVLWAIKRNRTLRSKVFSRVEQWMQSFGLASEIKLERMEASYLHLMLKDVSLGVDVNIADTGFGASQILPVIVEGFYSPPRSTLLIEQPEIHLHPRAQATLADLLIDISRDEKTLIVETHSEHLISRVQRRIAEGSLARENVAIYYCLPAKEGTEVQEIKLNELGQFEGEGLPEGFFEEGYRESLEHYQAIARRR